MAYSSIVKPSVYFNTKLYTGTGSSNAQTGVGFQPDMVWLKSRSFVQNHEMYDAVRTATKRIYPNLSNGEDTDTAGLTAFNSDGFTLGNSNASNKNGDTFASWNWKAGTTSGITTNASTDTTPSSYSFNQTSGISIVKYSGSGSTPTKIAHGLGVAPKMIIVKRLTGGADWVVGHQSLEWGKYLYLSSDAAPVTAGGAAWENTAPDSINFTVGDNTQVNASGSTYIAYCFAEKIGYSKFGSYVSNGVSGNGSFTYLGFKPSFVIHKRVDSSGDWRSWNNKADAFNQNDKSIFPNSNASEYDTTAVGVDFLSNGIKWRQTDTTNNNPSGGTFIYMAFAEEPLVANVGASIPATAR